MPPGYVKTIREEIFYEYGKLISRSVRGSLQHNIDDICLRKRVTDYAIL